MGMNEDDRIRYKNRYQSEAFDLYEGLKVMGYDHAHMIKYAEFALANTIDLSRSEVLNTMMYIVRSLDEKVTNT